MTCSMCQIYVIEHVKMALDVMLTLVNLCQNMTIDVNFSMTFAVLYNTNSTAIKH